MSVKKLINTELKAKAVKVQINAKFSATLTPTTTGAKYYMWGDGNDQYVFDLCYAVKNSAAARSAINERTRFIVGQPWEDRGLADRVVTREATKLTLDGLYHALCNQAAYWDGAFAILIQRDLNGRIAEVLPAQLQYYRRNMDNNGWLFSEFFGDKINGVRTQNYLRSVPDYDPNLTPEQGAKLREEMGNEYMGELIYRSTTDCFDRIYPYPAYSSSIEIIQTDSLIAQATRKHSRSGFLPRSVMTVYGNVDSTDSIQSGSSSGGPSTLQQLSGHLRELYDPDVDTPMVLITATNKDTAPVITTLPNDGLAQAAGMIQMDSAENVYRIFEVSPVLLGIAKAGQMGNSQELSNHERLCNQRFSPKRIPIIRELEGIFGITIEVKDVQGFEFIEPALLDVLTVDEKRARAGLPPSEVDLTSTVQKTIDTLNTMSPLLANKVLDSLTRDEIRALISFGPSANPPLNPLADATDNTI